MSAETRKRELRLAVLAHRDAAARDGEAAAHAVADRFPDGWMATPGLIVAGYRALGSELDPDPLMRRLAAAGARLALPVMGLDGEPLTFRAWTEGDPLERRAYNVEEPDRAATLVVPDLVLVPLVAIDRAGIRMGYGKGYYDRTLSALRRAGPVRAVGLAFDVQLVDSVPAEPHDEALDALVTPTTVHRFTEHEKGAPPERDA